MEATERDPLTRGTNTHVFAGALRGTNTDWVHH